MHHADDAHGLLTAERIAEMVAGTDDSEVFVCGPTAFMELVASTLRGLGVADSRIHRERFVPVEPEPPAGATVERATTAPTTEVTIRLRGKRTTVGYRPGTTVLQTARFGGLTAPSSCENGSCATCMARVVEGCLLSGQTTPRPADVLASLYHDRADYEAR